MIDFKEGMETETDFSPEDEKKAKKHKKTKKFFTFFGIIAIILLIFAGKIITSGSSSDSWFSRGFLGTLSHIATSSNKKLIGEDNDRVNILLLGIGGKNHAGGNLTDTIMLLSIKPSTNQMAMISIPRDMTVPTESGVWKKVNSINATAEAKEPGSGGEATAKALSELLGTPITYYVKADFEGFVNIINDMDGLTVNVENTLDDYAYPVLGEEDNPSYYARYEHLHVDAGEQTMDGSLALKFARSRHGVGKEGSDFARARRQQLIIQAVKNKLLSKSTLLKPAMIIKITNELSEHISTNLSVTEMLALWDLYKGIDQANVINKVLDNSANGLLVNQTGIDGAYLLMPRTGNYNEIKDFVENIFGSATPAVKIDALEKPVSLRIVNGTWVNGLATKVSNKLETYNFNTTRVNGTERNLTKSAIYDLSGNNNKAIKTLTDLIGATLSYDNPAWLENLKTGTSTTDLVLVLGTDAENWEIPALQK